MQIISKDNTSVSNITSSQTEAISSTERSFTLSISIMESNGLCCNGLNPVAKLEFLMKPSEPHFSKSPGTASFDLGIIVCKVLKQCFCIKQEDESRLIKFAADDIILLEHLADKRCIV